MRRTTSLLLAAATALASWPSDAAAAYGRAGALPAAKATVVTGVPGLVATPALSLSAAPLALAPSATLLAAPAPTLIAPAVSPAAAAVAAAPEAPAPAAEASSERRAAEAAVFFDQSALSAPADGPEVPGVPESPQMGPRDERGFRLAPSGPRPRRLMNHRLLGSRPEDRSALGRVGLFAARATGLRAVWLLYRDGILLQRHASRLRDTTLKPTARAASARLLAEMGAVEAAPLLGWAFEHDPSPRVRGAAGAGLLFMAEHSAPSLVRALRSRLTPAGREGAANALGWLVAHADAPAALQALGTAAVLDRSDDVRLAAIRALGRAESPRAAKLLFWVQAHAVRPALRGAVDDALRENASRQARAGRVHYTAPVDDFGEVSSPLQASALKRSVAVGLVFAALEFTGGVLTNNAALKADAIHLAGDRLLDATGLLALFLARRPPNSRQTYGFIKAEAVFALLGALVIAGVAAGMVPDVWHGLVGVYSWLFAGGSPLAGASWAVAGYAALGLASNLFSGYLLMRHREGSMTARAAFLHVMADAMGSAGIILTTVLGLLFGWTFLQPFVVAAIVYLILHTAWELGRPAWNVLMDATPTGVDLDKLETEFLAVPGVAGVHDLHVRMLNGSSSELAAKATVRPYADRDAVLAALQAMLREKYKITHATIQLEAAR